MKLLLPLIAMLTTPREHVRLRAMARLLAIFVVAVAVFTAGFLLIMDWEGHQHSVATGVYWTVVTMTTLGFGDITFESDLGRLYTLVVLLTGAVLILILLPFAFIQFVYVPWQEAQRRARTPRELPEDVSGHVLVTGIEPFELDLLRRAHVAGVPAAVIVEDPDLALSLRDEGYQVLYGPLDEPATYRAARAERAALLLTARSDIVNTNVVFTLREVADEPLAVATASSRDSIDVLELAGCDHVYHLGDLLGDAFARRVLAPRAHSRAIATFGELVVAEAAAVHTDLAGHTLAELDLRHEAGVTVVAVWERGALELAHPDTEVTERSVLVLAGRRQDLDAYDARFAHPRSGTDADDRHVVILGGGRVGRAAARAVEEGGLTATIVERTGERVRVGGDYVEGDAADREVLERAGIEDATAVLVTTHDDGMNIYLTLYARRLRPDVELLGRVNFDRNLSTMHRAGADFVLSYASTAAAEVWNLLREDSTMLLAEGLQLFRVPIPLRVAGRLLTDARIREETGASVVGHLSAEHEVAAPLSPQEPLPRHGSLLLIGDEDSEAAFRRRFLEDARGKRSWRWRLRERLGPEDHNGRPQRSP